MGSSQSRSEPRTASAGQQGRLEVPWRNIDWGQKAALINRLEEFTVCHPDVQCIKILLVGQVGAGKSSFINSVNSALQGRITSASLADSSGACWSHSFTQRFRTHRVRTANRYLNFSFCDIMGLESEAGPQPEEIINAIFGHVKEGYKFNRENPVTLDSEYFERNPDICDQVFCVVYIISAELIHFMHERLIENLRIIRRTISDRGIPQVIVMTKVDETCPLVRGDLRKIYISRRIKDKMEMCSDMLGVPMSFIFPVKNYHEEIDTDDNIDVLILKAVDQIVHVANDRLMDEVRLDWSGPSLVVR
ncbi:interferon-induced protein 44-like [Misgurnus anguillicaudatus]|uniref:interferon-induced protein 44-like n=1 Tax=Misgurnus anguillicaudatus TaxID=75329 RepID=UPI003CCF0413